MARLNTLRTLDRQTLIYDEMLWSSTDRRPVGEIPRATVQVRGKPSLTYASISNNDDDHTPDEEARPPYWEFNYALDDASGLRLTNVVVRDAISAGSSDDVFEAIEFADLEVEFDDGSKVPFDVAAALADPAAVLEVSESGMRTTVTPNDHLFQRGLKLTLTQNVLAGAGGTCNVTVEIAVVFRGAANDFDPGGVPVALDLWPQIGLQWERGSRGVKRMRGSVKLLLCNEMSMWPGHDHSGHSSGNVSSLFADSNESMNDGRADDDRLRAWGASWGGIPFGWLMVFDYVTRNLANEREIVGVYGPRDGNKYLQTPTTRRSVRYRYPLTSPYRIRVAKKDRQGDFDNIHTHAKMRNDSCGNVPIHAPFCGHSCVHMHWRWAGVAAEMAEGDRGWQFKGWSQGGVERTSRHTAILRPRAYAVNGAPLIPPNQRLQFAVCRPNATRHSADHIVDPASPAALDPLRKLYWYSVDVIEPQFEQRQVIFEHGIGWAYRYALPEESQPVDGLTDVISDDLPWTGTPTQAQMSEFFETVYEMFRYRDAPHIPSCTNGVPQGGYDGGTGIAMEDL